MNSKALLKIANALIDIGIELKNLVKNDSLDMKKFQGIDDSDLAPSKEEIEAYKKYVFDYSKLELHSKQPVNSCGVVYHACGFIGLGRFRPRNNGVYGRFDVKIISWEKED